MDATEPTRILFNTAFDLGWRTTVGTVENNGHLLAVDVPAGHHTMVVKYWPRGLTLGLFMTSFSILGIIAFFVWEARRRKRAVSA